MHYLTFVLNFFGWWYSKGILRLLNNQAAFILYLANTFSLKESLTHLFSPWKRLIAARRPGLDGFRDWIIDNLVSRGVGLFMRIFLILLFIIALLISITVCLFLLFLWLGWPAILIWIFWGEI